MTEGQHSSYLMATLATSKGATMWRSYKRRWQDLIDLAEVDVSGRSLKGYDLSQIKADQAVLAESDLDGAVLAGSSLRYADLRDANLHMANFANADLSFAILNRARVSDACFTNANLKGAHLAEADLTGADLSGADLSGADLRKAILKYAKLDGAILRGANLAEANMTGVALDPAVLTQGRNHNAIVIDPPKKPFIRMPIRKFFRPRPASAPSGTGTAPAPDAAAEQEKAAAQAAASPDAAGNQNGVQAAAAEAASASLPAVSPQAEGALAKQPQAGAPRIPGVGVATYYEEDGLCVPCWTAEPDLATVNGCCQVLGVTTNATMDEVVKAFRTKVKIYHPDRASQMSQKFQDLATEEFHRLHRAYEQLTRATTRPMEGIVWVSGLEPKETAYDYTIEEYRLLAQANQNNANVLYNLAWKYFEAGMHQEALDGFMRVLELNPNDADASFNAIICNACIQIAEVLS